MAQTIKLKRSATAGQIPTSAQLELGELAINTFDGKIYFKKDNGAAEIVGVGDTKGDNTFDGTNTFDGNVIANADVTIGDSTADTLTVNATSDFNGPVNIDGDLTTTANSTLGDDAGDTHTFNGNVTMNNDLHVEGALTTNGTGVFGNATGDTQTFNGHVDMNGNLNVDGIGTFNGNTTIGNASTDTLTVNADTTFSDDVSIAGITANEVVYANTTGDLDGSGNFTFDGTNAEITGRLDVDNIRFDGNTISTTTGNLTIDSAGTLEVSDAANFSSNVTIDGNVDLGNATGDTITFNGRVDSAINPSTNNARDLGATTLKWRDIFGVDVNGDRINGPVQSIRTSATDPATQHDGTALVEGDVYYNTADDVIKTYDGATWNAPLSAATLTANLTANEVVYANASGDLDGSANFTFDGTNADISGRLDVDNIRFDGNTISTTTGNLTINGAGTLEVLDVTNFNTDVTIDGNVDLGNANTDTITFNGRADSSLNPSTNNAIDLGATSLMWRDIYGVDVNGDRINGPVQSIRTSTTNPGTQHDGTVLAAGDMYYNTANKVIMNYDGAAWHTVMTANTDYGTTLSNGEIRLADDRRRNSNTTDVRSGNTHDYTHYDADIGISWYTGGTEGMRLEDDKDLHVKGDIIAFSTTVSDLRLKENIKPINNALDKVASIGGYTFNYIKDGYESAGLIAQEVEEVLPTAVKEKQLPLHATENSEDMYKVVQYDQVIGLLVEAVKELTAKVEALEEK